MHLHPAADDCVGQRILLSACTIPDIRVAHSQKETARQPPGGFISIHSQALLRCISVSLCSLCVPRQLPGPADRQSTNRQSLEITAAEDSLSAESSRDC